MLKLNLFYSKKYSSAMLVTLMLSSPAFAEIFRSGEAYIASTKLGSINSIIDDTGQLSASGVPPLEVDAPTVIITGVLAAGASSAMTQGTAHGADSEANLTNIVVTLTATPLVTFTASELKVQAHAFCDGERPIVFGSTDLDTGVITTTVPSQVVASGLVNQVVTLSTGGTLLINEQVITDTSSDDFNTKKISVNGLHFVTTGFDLILGHAEADVSCEIFDAKGKALKK